MTSERATKHKSRQQTEESSMVHIVHYLQRNLNVKLKWEKQALICD